MSAKGVISDSGNWLVPPTQLLLTPGEVHIWRVELDQPQREVRRLAQTLSSEELNRSGRLHFESGRKRFITGRGMLRVILSHYTGSAPGELKFKYGSYGKPTLLGPGSTNSRLHFNLSHSEGMAIYAIGLDYELGIDIERVRPMEDVDQIVERFFSARERVLFQQLAPEQQLRAFFKGWTRKEAFLKATGEGLTRPLEECEVTFQPDQAADFLDTGEESATAGWSLHSLEVGKDYLAAMAIKGLAARLAYWSLEQANSGLSSYSEVTVRPPASMLTLR